MSEAYGGPIKTSRDAEQWRRRAEAVGMPGAAALLAPHRWRMVAARPGLARQLVRQVAKAEPE